MEKTTTQVFAYKGLIGIRSSFEAKDIVNNPQDNGGLFLVRAESVQISPEALELLKKVPKGKDCIGDLMAYKAGEQKIFGWSGGDKRILGTFKKVEETVRGKKIKITHVVSIAGDVNYNPDILEATEGIEANDSFKKFVDKLPVEELEELAIK